MATAAPSLANSSSRGPSSDSPVMSISESRVSTAPVISLAWLVVGGGGGWGGGWVWPALRLRLLWRSLPFGGLQHKVTKINLDKIFQNFTHAYIFIVHLYCHLTKVTGLIYGSTLPIILYSFNYRVYPFTKPSLSAGTTTLVHQSTTPLISAMNSSLSLSPPSSPPSPASSPWSSLADAFFLALPPFLLALPLPTLPPCWDYSQISIYRIFILLWVNNNGRTDSVVSNFYSQT